jgi:2,3-bisphosphoglycerate-dependent phosphoglycerate mutase
MGDATRLCVTRHGETNWNLFGILQGWIDVPLNDNGRQQAVELAESLGRHGFARVCTSPLRRSAETAEIIAQCWGAAPPREYEGFKERNFGLIQGRPKSELSESHPGLHQEIIRRNPAAHFDEGESVDHFADRVIAALHEVADDHPGQRALIITHGWVMDVITRYINGLPRTTILDHKRRNGESIWLALGDNGEFFECGAP